MSFNVTCVCEWKICSHAKKTHLTFDCTTPHHFFLVKFPLSLSHFLTCTAASKYATKNRVRVKWKFIMVEYLSFWYLEIICLLANDERIKMHRASSFIFFWYARAGKNDKWSEKKTAQNNGFVFAYFVPCKFLHSFGKWMLKFYGLTPRLDDGKRDYIIFFMLMLARTGTDTDTHTIYTLCYRSAIHFKLKFFFYLAKFILNCSYFIKQKP